MLLEFGYSSYRGLPIFAGNEILIIIIQTAVITVVLITVEGATWHSDNDDNCYLKVLTLFFSPEEYATVKTYLRILIFIK